MKNWLVAIVFYESCEILVYFLIIQRKLVTDALAYTFTIGVLMRTVSHALLFPGLTGYLLWHRITLSKLNVNKWLMYSLLAVPGALALLAHLISAISSIFSIVRMVMRQQKTELMEFVQYTCHVVDTVTMIAVLCIFSILFAVLMVMGKPSLSRAQDMLAKLVRARV